MNEQVFKNLHLGDMQKEPMLSSNSMSTARSPTFDQLKRFIQDFESGRCIRDPVFGATIRKATECITSGQNLHRIKCGSVFFEQLKQALPSPAIDHPIAMAYARGFGVPIHVVDSMVPWMAEFEYRNGDRKLFAVLDGTFYQIDLEAFSVLAKRYF